MVFLLAIALMTLHTGPVALAGAGEGDVQVEARLTHSEATVGDRIGLEIVIRAPAGSTVRVPDLPLRVGDLDLIERLPMQESDDGTEQRHRYVLSPFQTGDLFVPPIRITYRLPNGTEETVETQTLPLAVRSVIPAGDPASEVRDLRSQAEVLAEPRDVPWPLIGGAAGGVIASLVVLRILWLLARRLARRQAPAPPVYLTPEDEARAALDQLAANGLPTRRTVKAHYATLSHIIRSYLSERHAIPALSCTTRELSVGLVERGVDRWQTRLVAGLLEECDAAHYAQYIPAKRRAEHDLSLAYEIIELARTQSEAAETAVTFGHGDNGAGGDDGAVHVGGSTTAAEPERAG
ncbi:MAG TPA: hypothetical protein VNL92_07210 [Dehalococcoidia bacterium]|nr:hypothetical protein [Dehalococcoidia bacterium]